VVVYTNPEEDDKDGAGEFDNRFSRKSPHRKLDPEVVGTGDFHVIYYIDINYIGSYESTMYIVKNVRYHCLSYLFRTLK